MATVHFFATCLLDQFDPDAAEAAVTVLEDAGCTVRYDPRQTCCGQPAVNLGHRDEARDVARSVLDLYRGTEGPIVVPSGSCAATMARLYPGLFAKGTSERADAEAFAARVTEWSAYLVQGLQYRPKVVRDAGTVTVHPSCHGLRELGIDAEPKQLLEAAGYTLVDLPRADHCCGFGGAFSVLLPEMSGAILRDKLDQIETTKAQHVASLDGGCLMHLRGGHEKRRDCAEGTNGCPRYRHVAALLAAGADHEGPA